MNKNIKRTYSVYTSFKSFSVTTTHIIALDKLPTDAPGAVE
jgi:hypothetical protein